MATGLLSFRDSRQAAPLYADTIDDAALHLVVGPGSFVIKTHLPAASLRALCPVGAPPVVLTVRDPRDAAVSLMQRFGLALAAALDRIEPGADLLLRLWRSTGPQLLRYEDGFAGSGGISAIAAHLDVILSEDVRQQLDCGLSPGAVAHRVQGLLTSGTLRGENPATEWGTGTQWPPFHIGDGRSGKFRNVLTDDESNKVLQATRPFCAAFGYAGRRTDSFSLPREPQS